MIWELLGIDEDCDLSMRASYSSHSPYCYLENQRRRVGEDEIRSLDGDPCASGERSLSGGVRPTVM